MSITVKTRIIGLCVRTLDLPLLVRFGVFVFFFCLGRGRFLVCFSPSFPEEEISDYIAHGSTIQVFMVL